MYNMFSGSGDEYKARLMARMLVLTGRRKCLTSVMRGNHMMCGSLRAGHGLSALAV